LTQIGPDQFQTVLQILAGPVPRNLFHRAASAPRNDQRFFHATKYNKITYPGRKPESFIILRVQSVHSTMKGSRNDFNCIAVDMGAGSIRIMLGAISGGRISYREVHRFANEIVHLDGYDRWNMARIESGVRTGIRKGIEDSGGPVQSIGVDSWGADFVLLDRNGKPEDLPVAYRDKRTEGMRERWGNLMGEMDTFQRTGINFYAFNTLFQLLSMKESEQLKQTSRVLFIPCYINYILSGVALNELTISSTSQMLSVGGMQWDAEILARVGLEPRQLGRVIEPGTRLGEMRLPEAAGQGIENVAVCGHDTAGVVAALPVENPNFAYISAGTWCILGVESEQPLITGEALHLGFTNERGFGNSYRTLKNIAGMWLLQGLKRDLPSNTSFSEMEQMVRQGEKTIQVIDPDDPLFYHPADMKEAFDAYFKRTGQHLPGEYNGYLRCAYDSLCFSFRFHVDKLEQLTGRSIEVLHVVGGGSRSDYLNQRIATICGRKVISGPVEGATLGNLLVQALAMGRIGSLERGRRLIRESFSTVEYFPEIEPAGTSQRYARFLTYKSSKKH
jgi:rhamnulokinase